MILVIRDQLKVKSEKYNVNWTKLGMDIRPHRKEESEWGTENGEL